MDKQNLEKSKKLAKDITKELLKKLDIEAKIRGDTLDDSVKVDIEGEDLGLLIGYHGETLESLQLIVSLLVNNKLEGEWVPISLDIGGWKEERSESLRNLVEKVSSEVKGTNKEVALQPMSSQQRRTIHLILSDYPELTSVSEGEEPNRRVVIKKTES